MRVLETERERERERGWQKKKKRETEKVSAGLLDAKTASVGKGKVVSVHRSSSSMGVCCRFRSRCTHRITAAQWSGQAFLLS